MMQAHLGKVRAAAVQAEPVVLDRERTVEKACRLIAEAAKQGAGLVVFPEAFIPCYVNASVWGRGMARFGSDAAKRAWARLWQNSVEIPGPETEALGKAARAAGAVVAMGLHERSTESGSLHNTILLLGPDGGILGRHRKLVPTNHERMIHAPGDGSTLDVFSTPAGRIGGLVCWENWMPLARYALYARGEQIHLAPHADDREIFLVNARNTAVEGGVFVLSVCSVMKKTSFPPDFELAEDLAAAPEDLLTGGSAVIGPDGSFLAGPLWNEEGILYADLDLGRLVEQRQLLDVAGHFARPDVLSLRFDDAPRRVLETTQSRSREHGIPSPGAGSGEAQDGRSMRRKHDE
jgi:nitrilase